MPKRASIAITLLLLAVLQHAARAANLIELSPGLEGPPASLQLPNVDEESATEQAIRFIRARALARHTRPIEALAPARLVAVEGGSIPYWQITLGFTNPRYGRPAEAVVYVDAVTGTVVESELRVEPMISEGNPVQLTSLEQALVAAPFDAGAYRRWANYFAFRGNQRHIKQQQQRVAALGIFEPEGTSHYRLLFNSPRRIDEVRVTLALMPPKTRIVSLGRYCPSGASLINPTLLDAPITTAEFADLEGAEARYSCGESTRLYAIVLALNHRDARQIDDTAEGLVTLTPIVTTWAQHPDGSLAN